MSTEDNDERYFTYVYETYGQRVLGFLVSYFRDMDIAEEAYQDTFMAAYINLDHLRTHPNPGGWLITTAKNKGRNIRDKKARMSGLQLDESYIAPGGTFFTEDSNLMKFDDPVFLDEQYKPLRLKYAYGYKISEIAQLYNINLNACKMRLNRAKNQARKHLGEKEDK